MARRGYPPEFRRRVIDLVEGGRKISELAAELEVSAQTIYTWRRQARIDAGLEAGDTTSEEAELAAAKRRIRELETVGEGSVSARCLPNQMHGMRRVGHLDSLVFEAPFDLEVDLLDAGEVFRVVEVLAPVGEIENQR